MLYLLHFVVIASSVTLDGNRIPKGAQISIRSNDPRAAEWEASPRWRLTGRELIGSVSSEATAAASAHAIVDRILAAFGDLSAAVGALDDAGRAAMAQVWDARRDAVHDAGGVFHALDALLPGPGDEPQAESVSVSDPPFGPPPEDDGWADAKAPTFDRAALEALVADEESTLRAMTAAIEGLPIDAHPTKKAQREAISAFLAAHPG